MGFVLDLLCGYMPCMHMVVKEVNTNTISLYLFSITCFQIFVIHLFLFMYCDFLYFQDELSLTMWLANKDSPDSQNNQAAMTQFMSGLLVPKAMNIDQLKQALLSTAQFQDLMIPTQNFMRLRTLEGSCLKGVVRANSQVLRYAQLSATLVCSRAISLSYPGFSVTQL